MCSDGQGPDAAGSTTCAGNSQALRILLDKSILHKKSSLSALSHKVIALPLGIVLGINTLALIAPFTPNSFAPSRNVGVKIQMGPRRIPSSNSSSIVHSQC